MSRPGLWLCAAMLGVGLSLALLLTPLARLIALRQDMVDRPGPHKTQQTSVPYLGGVAIVIAFCIAITLAHVNNAWEVPKGELITILAAGIGLSVVGLYDDLSGGISPWLRLSLQSTASVILVLAGITFSFFANDLVNDVVTVAWIVGITNAFNLLDNMDGLSAGVAAIAAIFFCVIALLNEQYVVAPLAAALAGCALGFLRLNFHPARIYMGDAGSLFIGFILAIIGIKLTFHEAVRTTLFIPILVLGVAIFDTTLVTVTRVLQGRSPLNGARDHVSHRLVSLGVPVPSAVTLIYAMAVLLGVLGLATSGLTSTSSVLLPIVVIGSLTGLGVLLSRVSSDETEAWSHDDMMKPSRSVSYRHRHQEDQANPL
jgi:UDP-GlcNAc:undecaprenyl-phosphate/decaprenyl-phosphate GlcNAc-1-phosphate transferase